MHRHWRWLDGELQKASTHPSGATNLYLVNFPESDGRSLSLVIRLRERQSSLCAGDELVSGAVTRTVGPAEYEKELIVIEQ